MTEEPKIEEAPMPENVKVNPLPRVHLEPITIREAKKRGLKPIVFLSAYLNVPETAKVTWDSIMRLANQTLVQGEPYNDDCMLGTVMKGFMAGQKTFLG